ncbi:trifunctional enzyme subunit alpha [Trichuris trichiura]|uniref:Trifunctional enzyme subunit alpha, mitochondrial n=1 Tax=Trichuris trichiura TaxID=36087 RepID=A0A077YXD7_TRITR|nr:trifunctional enzyme subunit alpha [Trichuris trichiura]
MTHVKSYKNGEVGIIKLNCPDKKENVVNVNVMIEVFGCLNALTQDSSVKGILVLSGKPNSFIAGADTNMIANCQSLEEATALSLKFQGILNRIHANMKPVVAGIMGTCLGGGLELALACDYRIAVNTPKTIFGLPEVRLGLLPGGGGTQRLPRLISLTDGLDLILTGRTVNVAEAKRLGLVDLVIEPLEPGLTSDENFMVNELESGSVKVVRQLLTAELVPMRSSRFPKNLMNSLFDVEIFKNLFFAYMANKVDKMTGGHYPAPPLIVNVVRKGYKFGIGEGLKSEAKAFGILATSPESKCLLHLFNASNECKKNPYGAPKKAAEVVGVVGAGLMGTGIAQVTIDKNIRCVLKDIDSAVLLRSEKHITDALNRKLKRRKITPLQKDLYLSNLIPSVEYKAIKDANIVIEAVFEDLKLKQKIITELEQHVGPDCVIATNTSAISVSKIAEASKRPENVVGLHYFSPVDRMQLLEVIVTPKSSKEAISRAVELGLKQGKLVITAKDSPGFYTTRILSSMLLEMLRLLQEGVDPVELNKLSTKFGFPMGFVTLGDEVGLDVSLHILKYLGEQFGRRMSSVDLRPLQKMVDANMLGRKTGKGAFEYGSGKKSTKVNKAAISIFKEYAKAVRGCDSDHERQMRMVCRFVNEAVMCLQEGVITSPAQGDIGAVFGLGFPPFMGGPFRFLDSYGAERLVREMDAFHAAYDNAPEFVPCDLLREHAKDSNRHFYVI